jgi:type I restriction enzyme M protein
MLDTDTKRRIDTARDILVGKVPDPKSQVEQITIAMIYKFMDDMDAESEEFGGKRKFFAGEFARYGWAKLMRSGLGGHETLNLYAEAIAKMPENPGIPLLFRDIFKNAYLPYRDPETLRAFLKIIDEFTYDHSERLGDAFEYLLSVLGSQGDAGQFRTPRHIIDFIVEVIDPKKTETVLDPACGTAGFLISSYKHILKQNTSPLPQAGEGSGVRAGDLLTPDDKGRLAQNFKGYDISPDMVRLSLVNLYLHGFADPHIHEYDALTSQERWNEYADVILANPPFMSPKGGIKPHNRFSVQSKRSEVLFVDYMAEHLTPTGRAGIIVPEGIIFQSQTTYTQLRKMLVEEYLVAVVSLPAGVFNPYSGVKTSILILDKSLARQAQTIGFFKIENDGFGLGAQRRAIDKDDLPQARAEIAEYLRRLRARDTVLPSPSGRGAGGEGWMPTLGLVVPKEKIAANREYNLSGERYREGAASLSDYPHVTLSEVCEINPDTANPAELYPNSHFNYIDISCVENETGKFLGPNKTATNEAPSRARRSVKRGDVLISTVRPNLRAFAILTEIPDRAIASTGFAVLRAKVERLLPGFLISMLRHEQSVDQMVGMMGKGAYPSINQSDVESVQIPLPPMEVQKEIVAEIEGYQKVIDGARAVLDHYRPHIPIHPDWPIVELGEMCTAIQNGYPVEQIDEPGRIKVTRIQTIADGTVDLEKTKWTNDAVPEDRLMQTGDILFSHINSIDHLAKTAIFVGASVPVVHGINLIRFQPKRDVVVPAFLLWSMKQDGFVEKAKTFAQRAVNQASIKVTDIRAMEIALPPLATQQTIVAEIEAEQALVNTNRELIARFEKKIQATLARVWGEDELAPAE